MPERPGPRGHPRDSSASLTLTHSSHLYCGGCREFCWEMTANNSSFSNCLSWAFLVAQRVKSLPAKWETWVRSLGQEDPLEKKLAAHSGTFAWRIHGQRSLVGFSPLGWTQRSDFTLVFSVQQTLRCEPRKLRPGLIRALGSPCLCTGLMAGSGSPCPTCRLRASWSAAHPGYRPPTRP